MHNLTETQKQDLSRLAAVGCRRATAARYVGCTPQQITAAAAADPAFAGELRRSEAAIELAHMRCVMRAIQDEKNYRAAIWWLENAAPEGYLRRATDALSKPELTKLLAAVNDAIQREVAGDAERVRLAARLGELAGGPPSSQEGRQ
ncbi:hypothetical protein KOR34_49010 [Posidoniimonas corsicana]|uniref:Uncharacterized protein n=1 Tax=Posidoniimonas corsicana TaxID=1938618 RepID=A0A5C5UXG9_9BACT|nr:hypothetical protein [Posidoniimonas corsicana]TWT30343.1 hypothetical protein KOR34_49010 [Posidoniimonas corsicana]